MRTAKNRAYPLGQLIGCKQPIWLYHLALGMDPFGLYGVEPWAPLGQQADDDPYSLAAPFDPSVVGAGPFSNLPGDVPASVVPDQHPNLLAGHFELLAAPRKEAGGYSAYRAAIHEPKPHSIELGHVEPVTGDGLRIGVIFGDRLSYEAQRLPASAQLRSEDRASLLHQVSSRKPTVHSGRLADILISRSRRLFFSHTSDRERLSTASLVPSALLAVRASPGRFHRRPALR
jgi:hypothetical protein